MNEFPNASQPVNKEDIWNYIKDNPRIIGFPISETNGLDLLSALRDVWLEIQINPKAASEMLTVMVSVILASTMGHGNEAIEEVLVQEAMHKFDTQAKEILNERPE